jgi:hypothetical protein
MKTGISFYCLALGIPFLGMSQLTYIATQTFIGNSVFNPQYIEFTPSTGNTIDIKCTTQGTTNEFIGADHLRIKPTGTGEVHARLISNNSDNIRFRAIDNSLDIQYFNVPTSNVVNIFDKVEIGVNFPTIDTKIAEFINDPSSHYYKPGTSFYNTSFANGTIINPYDPEQITVDAVFFAPNATTSIVRHGFYYKEFQAHYNGSIQDDWSPVATDYEWRIRFAPDQAGPWTGYVNIWIGGQLVTSTALFSFVVIDGPKPGIVKIASNNQYLYFSKKGDSFIPIGDDFAWTKEQGGWQAGLPPNDPKYDPCNTINCSGGQPISYSVRMAPTANAELKAYIDKLTQYGGNTTQLVMVPWGFFVEYEKLCNYSTRDVEMWELDQYINYLEQKGVYLMLSHSNIEFNVTSGIYNNDPTVGGNPTAITQQWDWNPYRDWDNDPGIPGHTNNPYNPYDDAVLPTVNNSPHKNYKGVDGIYTLTDFFNPTGNAAKFYKNRLRYIESRWGYSPNVYMYQPNGELEGLIGLGGTNGNVDSYWNDHSIDADLNQSVVDWMDAMSGYLKNTLNSHMLTTTNYMRNFPDLIQNGETSLFKKQNIDVIQWHEYDSRELSNNITRQSIKSIKDELKYNTVPSVEKPLVIGELDDALYYRTYNCTDRPSHNRMWATGFMGTIGPGYLWDSEYRNFSGTEYGGANDYEGEYNKNYNAVKSFFSEFDFKNYSFEPKSSCTGAIPSCSANQQKFDIYYLQRDDNKLAIGWLHNRSFHDLINTNCNKPISYDIGSNTYTYTSMEDFLTNIYPASDQLGLVVNAPQYNGPGAIFYGEDGFVTEFGAGPPAGNYNYQPTGAPSTLITINGFLTAGSPDYTIEWYWTWGDNGGTMEPTFTGTAQVNSSGQLSFNSPPTGRQANDAYYPADWAFKIYRNDFVPKQGVILPTPSELLTDITVFPNPSNGGFNIQSNLQSIQSITITNCLGGAVAQLNQVNSKTLSFDLSKENRGLYFIQINLEGINKPIFKKIILQ